MWTIVGIFTFTQFALIKLSDDINKAWRVRFYLFKYEYYLIIYLNRLG